MSWDFITEELAGLGIQYGGQWSPSNITINSSEKVAIIVPYKNRLKNLKSFIRYMHPFLMQQNANYGIYIVEQADGLEFNRAFLLNIGFSEALKDNKDWTCFVYHDVDLLPESPRNLYQCQTRPTQFAITVNIYKYSEIDYFKNRYLGGVTAFSRDQFEAVNGYSNLFFGWGGEDDDAYLRCQRTFKGVNRLQPKVGKYFANCHKQEVPNQKR